MSVLLPLEGANIGRKVEEARARRAIRAMRQGVPQEVYRKFGVTRPGVCWQEINDDNPGVDERDLITEAFPPESFTTWPRFDHRVGSLVPITMPLPWRADDQWADLLGHGKALVQPDRYITVRVMLHPLLSAPLGVVSWQQVQGAFTDPGQPWEQYRHDEWFDQWHAVQVEVRDLVRDGITVAYAADTNRPRCPLLRWDDTRVVQQGLDALGYVPGRGRSALDVKVRRTWRVPLPVDGHDGTGALLALS